MVVAAFPLAKIGLLFLKQLSKPLANLIKNEAKKHPLVRKHVILPTGKAYRWVEEQTQIRFKGIKQIEPMSEEEIVELGANAIGEIILFGLLSILVLAEYNRQGDKKASIQKTKEEEMTNLQDTVLEMLEEMGQLKKTVEKIQTDLETASDVIELEEQRHTVIHDHNFWDILGSRKGILRREKKPNDISSPSI